MNAKTKQTESTDGPPSTLTRQVGARLRAARGIKGTPSYVTQDALCKRTGISQAGISNYELMRALGRDASALFTASEDPIVDEAGALLLELESEARAMIMDTLRGAVARQRARRA